MLKTSKTLVNSLKNEDIRWEEYSRTLVDKTLISALSAVYLGAAAATPKQKMEKSWPTVTGNLLPPLVEFLNETETAMQEGELLTQKSNVEFGERKMGWPGLTFRVIRYMANPSHSFFSLGEYYVRQEQGFKEMRRNHVSDGRACPDCVQFGQMGWQPIGTLPMPGQQCRCYDLCRCSLDYR